MTAGIPTEQVAEAIFRADRTETPWLTWEQLLPEGRDEYLAMAQAAIDALQLTEEHQYVPITESGSRWTPRTQHAAEAAMARYPVRDYDYGDHDGGVASISHESRLVSPWVPVVERSDL